MDRVTVPPGFFRKGPWPAVRSPVFSRGTIECPTSAMFRDIWKVLQRPLRVLTGFFSVLGSSVSNRAASKVAQAVPEARRGLAGVVVVVALQAPEMPEDNVGRVKAIIRR